MARYELPDPYGWLRAIMLRTGCCFHCQGHGFEPLPPNEDKEQWSDDYCEDCKGTGKRPTISVE